MAVVHKFRRSKPSAEKGSSDLRSVGKGNVRQLSSQNCNSRVKWMRGRRKRRKQCSKPKSGFLVERCISPDLEAALPLDEQRKRKESCFAYL